MTKDTSKKNLSLKKSQTMTKNANEKTKEKDDPKGISNLIYTSYSNYEKKRKSFRDIQVLY